MQVHHKNTRWRCGAAGRTGERRFSKPDGDATALEQAVEVKGKGRE